MEHVTPVRRQSQHPDGEPRPLTARETALIAWALRKDPPIHARTVLAPTLTHKVGARQPWETRQAA